MINIGQLEQARIVGGQAQCELLDGLVQVEQGGAGGGVTHQRLDPEKGCHARAARDRRDPVQAGGRIQHHVARGQLDGLAAEGILDLQLAAIVVVRLGQEQSRRQIGAQALVAVRQLHDGAVDVQAVAAARFITIKAGRIDLARQGRRDELGLGAQLAQQVVAQLHGQFGAVIELAVVLDLARQAAAAFDAVFPVRSIEVRPELAHFVLAQYLFDGQQHGVSVRLARAGHKVLRPISARRAQPASAMHTSSSSRRQRSMCATPSAPATASAYICRRPISTASAPSANALKTSAPLRMPPSNSSGKSMPTAARTAGSRSRLAGAPSRPRPPWLETTMPATDIACRRRASSGCSTPFTQTGSAVFASSQARSSQPGASRIAPWNTALSPSCSVTGAVGVAARLALTQLAGMRKPARKARAPAC